MKSLRTASRQKQKQQLDRLFAAKVKLRDHYRCRICNSGHNPQCAHLFSRRYMGTRWNLDAAWTLCAACHRHYTDHPKQWRRLLTRVLGENEYERLRVLAQGFNGPDMETVREGLLNGQA